MQCHAVFSSVLATRTIPWIPCRWPATGRRAYGTRRNNNGGFRRPVKLLMERRSGLNNVDSQVEDPEADDVPRTPSPRQKLKLEEHLDRLDPLIDPLSLDATLEAHRKSNQEVNARQPGQLVMRFGSTLEDTTNSPHADAEVHVSKRGYILKFGSRKEKPKKRDETTSSPHSSAPTKEGKEEQDPDSPEARLTDMLGPDSTLRKTMMEQAQNRDRPGHHHILADSRAGHGREEQRREFLRKYEDPLQPFSEVRSREAYFDTIRRARWILTRKTQAAAEIRREVSPNILEYEGRSVALRPLPQPAIDRPPWSRLDVRTSRKRLNREAADLVEWMRPTSAEEQAKDLILKQAVTLIHAAAPACKMSVYGSNSTGLALPISDIDIQIDRADRTPPQLTDSNRKGKLIREDLANIEAALKSSEHFKLTVSRSHHHHPLITTTHAETGQTIQIVASSLDATLISRRKQEYFTRRFQSFKQLYLVLKTALHMRGLDDVWTGGLGSYTLIAMIAAYYTHTVEKASGRGNPTTIETDEAEIRYSRNKFSDHLVGFLEMWSQFKTDYWGTSVVPAYKFRKTDSEPTLGELERMGATADNLGGPFNPILRGRVSIRKYVPYQPYLLCLQDPANPYNDLGKASFAIKDVQATFLEWYQLLQAELTKQSEERMPSVGLLEKLVGRADTVFELHRARMELFAEKHFPEDEGANDVTASSPAEEPVEEDDSGERTTSLGGNTMEGLFGETWSTEPVDSEKSVDKNDWTGMKTGDLADEAVEKNDSAEEYIEEPIDDVEYFNQVYASEGNDGHKEKGFLDEENVVDEQETADETVNEKSPNEAINEKGRTETKHPTTTTKDQQSPPQTPPTDTQPNPSIQGIKWK